MKQSNLSDSRVLVTGATGFIGSRLSERLANKENAQVVGVGRDLKRAKALKKHNVEFKKLDLTDPIVLKESLKGVEILFNCAGALSADPSIAELVNVKATNEMIKAASEAGVKRFVHISTVGVYDMKGISVVDESTPLALDHPSSYPRTKARGEKIAFEQAQKYGIELTVLRPSMVYGPGNGIWTTTMFNNVCSGKPVFLGDGESNFNPVYIDDVIDALVRAATYPEAPGEAFNISSEVTTWKIFMNYYGELCGKEPKGIPVFIARIMAAANKIPGIQAPIDKGFIEMATGNKFFPIGKAQNLLGWKPLVNLDEGMEKTAAWLKEQGLLSQNKNN
ncbi:NAD(P)-dependent oxidoreductase [Salegentibacter sp. JZCK2]|uniref:NAD-dependent epimerase/dehydratase family protein n=1 Tax=Salegentibacter tibetensis TaxID=2873600 RepID=UPI001CCD7C95|nr:NAD(P)-dependent oxidoreductase [Salegentibacter tibetensis]MBZ9728390.1 NAD(P)-dependent oxidoreductase [Salegentibacter tibetensis]